MKLWQDKTVVTALKGVLEDYPYLEYDEAKSKIFSTGTTDVLSVKVTDLSTQEEVPDLSELDLREFADVDKLVDDADVDKLVDELIDLEIQRAQRARRDDYRFEICKLLEEAPWTWGHFFGYIVESPEGKYFNIKYEEFIGDIHLLNSVPIHEGGGSTWDLFCRTCGKNFSTMHCYYLAYDPYETVDLEICQSCQMKDEEQGRNDADAEAARAYKEEYGERVTPDWDDF